SVPPRLASTPFAAGFESSAVGANWLCRLKHLCELVADGAVPGRLQRTPPKPGDSIARIGLLEQLPGARPKVMDALRGSDFIVPGGDVGDPQVLRALSRLAPVTAVRGNVDRGPWASSLPETEVLPSSSSFTISPSSTSTPRRRASGR